MILEAVKNMRYPSAGREWRYPQVVRRQNLQSHFDALVNDTLHDTYPKFKYTSIQINRSLRSFMHVDKHNVGPSRIIGGTV